jgi:hypothetical protein
MDQRVWPHAADQRQWRARSFSGSADGTTVEDKQVGIGDVLSTLCSALGVPPDHENVTASNRPIKLAEGSPIQDILA